MQQAMGWARSAGLIFLALLLLITLILGYCLVNPNTLKPFASWIIEWALDRSFEIDGDLELSLSMRPVVSVTQARLGNAPGGAAPHMVSASYASAQIDLAALFQRRVHLLDLQAREAELYLEDSVAGTPNWEFFEPAEESDGNEWSFMIQQMEIRDSRIFASIGELAPIELTIPFLEETSDAAEHLSLNGHGTLNGDPWRVSGRIGPFSELLVAGQLTLNLELMVDDAEIGVQGGVGDLATLTGIDLSLTIYGPDADLLGEIFRMPQSFADDIALQADIRPDPALSPDGQGHAISVIGHIADFDIETAGTITHLAALDGWDGSAHISGPDLGVVGKALQIEGFPDGPFEVHGTLHLHGGDLDLKEVSLTTEDVTLLLEADFEEFPRREGAFGSIRLSGQDISEFRQLLRLPNLPTVPFDIDLTLDATGSEILNSTVKIGTHTLELAGAIGEFPDYTGTDLEVNANGEDLATLLAGLGIQQPLHGPYRLESRLIRDGDGLRLRDSTLSMAGQSVSGEVIWREPLRPTTLEIRGQLEVNDLAQTAALFGADNLPPYPLTTNAVLSLANGSIQVVESTTRLRSLVMLADGQVGQPGTISELDLNIELSGKRLLELFEVAIAADRPPNPFELKANIQGSEGALRVSGFQLTAPGGIVNASGTLALTPDWVGSSFTLDSSGDQLNRILPDFPNYVPPAEAWKLHAYVELPDPDHLLVREGRLEIGSASLTLDGVLDTEDQTRTEFTFSLRGNKVADVGRIGEIPWPDHPFELSADVDGTLNTLHINNLAARWGDSDLSGDGSVFLDDRLLIEVQGKSNLLDIYDLQYALFGSPEDIEPEDDLDKVFTDKPIPLHLFADFDGSLDIQVDRFRGQRTRLEDISLELDIKDGALKLNRAAYRDDTGYFDATALLRPEGDDLYMELVLAGEDVDVGLFTSQAQNKESIPRYSIDVDIHGRGITAAELAANLNGTLLISSNGGEIDNSLVEALGGDFLANVLETLNPFVESEEFTQMECLVLNAAVENGRLSMEPGFVMRTDRLNMFVYGGVNLERETLDLSLATQARRGIGISAASITNPYFKIGGTLASPALQLDPASAAVAASVATATAGLSILLRGVFERLMGTQNPCPEFLKYEQTVPESADAALEPDGQS